MNALIGLALVLASATPVVMMIFWPGQLPTAKPDPEIFCPIKTQPKTDKS